MAMTRDDFIQRGRECRTKNLPKPAMKAGSWQERAWTEGYEEMSVLIPEKEMEIEPAMSPLSDFTASPHLPMPVREHIKHLMRIADREPLKAERLTRKVVQLSDKWRAR